MLLQCSVPVLQVILISAYKYAHYLCPHRGHVYGDVQFQQNNLASPLKMIKITLEGPIFHKKFYTTKKEWEISFAVFVESARENRSFTVFVESARENRRTADL
jgi:hypothetical protein